MYFSLLVIDLPNQYKTIHCKSIYKNNVYNKWYQTYHNSLESLNQFIYKFPKTFYSVQCTVHWTVRLVYFSIKLIKLHVIYVVMAVYQIDIILCCITFLFCENVIQFINVNWQATTKFCLWNFHSTLIIQFHPNIIGGLQALVS